MRIQIYTRDELWKMTPRKLRLELKKINDYGKAELIQEQRRINQEAEVNRKQAANDTSISEVKRVGQAIAGLNKNVMTENDVLAHACGYRNVIRQIIDKKEDRGRK